MSEPNLKIWRLKVRLVISAAWAMPRRLGMPETWARKSNST